MANHMISLITSLDTGIDVMLCYVSVNYKVFRWSFRNAVNKKTKWCFRIMTKFRECNLELYTDLENILHKNAITQLEDFVFDKYKVNWNKRIFSQNVGHKLRTYKLLKEVFEKEMYLSKNISSRYRSAFAKFRCGVAPLRIETGRYENKNVNERVCFICHEQIEDEKHVLLDCPLNADLRESLFNEVKRSSVHFNISSDDDKLIYLFKSTECYDRVAKTCFNILSRRNSFLYS
jgi:hypothetical protein